MLYKQVGRKKAATFRQTFWCILIGAISGVYAFQPILKIMHKDEGGFILKVVGDIEDPTEYQEPVEEK